MANEASVGLRVYLIDEVSAGLSAISDLLQTFANAAQGAGQAFSDAMGNVGQSAKNATDATAGVADATNAASEGFTNASQSANNAAESITSLVSAMSQAAETVSTLGTDLVPLTEYLPPLADDVTALVGPFTELNAPLDGFIVSITEVTDELPLLAGPMAQVAEEATNLSNSFAQAAQAAAQADSSFYEDTGILTTLQEHYVETEEAATGVASIFSELSAKGASTSGAMQDLSDTTNNSNISFFHAFMALQMMQQTMQQLNATMQSSVQSAGDLQDAFIRADIATKATGQDVTILNTAIVNLSDQSKFSTQEIADGFQLMGERGYNTTQIVQDGLGQAIMDLAEITKSDMAPATDLVTVALRDFGASASDAQRYASALSYAFFNGIPDVAGLTSALEHVGPAASSLHIPFEDVIASLIYLSQHGMPDVSQAGTALNYMLQAMAAPTSTAAKMLKEIGVSFYDMHGNLKPLPQMISDLFTALDKQPRSQIAEDLRSLFNIRSGAGGRILGNDKNIKGDIGNITSQVKNAEGSDYLGKQIDQLRGDFNQTLSRLQSTWNSTVALLFMPLAQWLTPILDQANRFISAFSHANPLVREFINIFAGMALVIAPIAAGVSGFAMFATLLSGIIAPLLLVVAGVTLLAGGVALIIEGIQHGNPWMILIGGTLTAIAVVIFSALVPSLIAATAGFFTAAAGAWAMMAPFLPIIAVILAVAAVIAAIIVVVQHWGQIAHWLQGVWSAILGWLSNVWKGVQSAWTATLRVLGTVFQGIWNGIIAALRWVGNLFKSIFNAIVGVLQWFYNHNYYVKDFVDAMKVSWDKMIAAIQWAWNFVTSIVKIAFALLGVLWKQITKGIHDDLVVPWQNLMNLIGSIITGAVNFVTGKWHDFISWVSSWGPSFVHTVSQGLSNFTQMLNNTILKPINNLAGQLFQAGINFMTMLGNGIKSGIGWVWDQIKNLAGGIWKMLGFHSPTKEGILSESDRWMPNMMKMFAGGILSHAHLVTGAVGVVASGIHSGITSPTVARMQFQAAQAQAAQGTANTTVNLNVDGRQMGSVVFNRLTGEMQLNGMNRAWR